MDHQSTHSAADADLPRVTLLSDAADPVRVISAAGAFDLGSLQQLQDVLAESAGDAAVRTVLDLSRVTFGDSSLLNLLLSTHSEQNLVLAGPLSPPVHRLFQVTGTDTIFAIAPDLDAARSA
ncbi:MULTISPECIES: STAS domain-containing protein [unclassified Streptomyces]|uniref:STAS domain-containing protein n=1 Tax=unclassified Streptomyces TaxID=2593676 RepID=UPI0028C3C9F2|nr:MULTISPECIES: STAS domain-containing protein [unclassified Streptomyces]WNO71588.1 STAS domain-containing protein [Streptomyces sp. AM8-1-1]